MISRCALEQNGLSGIHAPLQLFRVNGRALKNRSEEKYGGERVD